MFTNFVSAALGIGIALLLAFPLGTTLKKHPAPFYFVAFLIVALHLAYRVQGAYIAQAQIVLDAVNKAYLGSALLAIVMFTGVLQENSSLRQHLQPIRAELAILSFIFICDHMIGYAPSFFPVLGRLFSVRAGMAVSIVAAVVLALVFAVLSATSLRAIRRKMSPHTWKHIQRGSYAMVALLWVHIVLVLGRTAFGGSGSPTAITALVVYTVIIALYVVLRIRKALHDRKARS